MWLTLYFASGFKIIGVDKFEGKVSKAARMSVYKYSFFRFSVAHILGALFFVDFGVAPVLAGCSWHTEYGITFCNANTYEGECDSYNDDCWVYTDTSERLCCAKSEEDCCNSSSAAVGVAIGILVSIAISFVGCICACCFCCPGCPMHQRRQQQQQMQANAQIVHAGAISLPQFGASLTYSQPMTAAPMAHPMGTAPLSQQAVYAGVQPATTQPPVQPVSSF